MLQQIGKTETSRKKKSNPKTKKKTSKHNLTPPKKVRELNANEQPHGIKIIEGEFMVESLSIFDGGSGVMCKHISQQCLLIFHIGFETMLNKFMEKKLLKSWRIFLPTWLKMVWLAENFKEH